jgi:hypothetical protein
VEPRTVTPTPGLPPSTPPDGPPDPPTPGSTGRMYSGWLGFAGALIIFVAIANMIQGLVAIFQEEYFVVTEEKILVFDFTTWGWILLFLGAFELLVGLGILANQVWARVAGVVLTIVLAVSQIGFLAAFPIWSVLMISLSIVVIYALIVPPSDPSPR